MDKQVFSPFFARFTMIFLYRSYFVLWSAFTVFVLPEAHVDHQLTLLWFEPHNLHGHVVFVQRHALQALVRAAARAPHERHAGRLEDVLHLLGVLLVDVHQHLPHLAVASLVHVEELYNFGCFSLSVTRGWSCVRPLGIAEVHQRGQAPVEHSEEQVHDSGT